MRQVVWMYSPSLTNAMDRVVNAGLSLCQDSGLREMGPPISQDRVRVRSCDAAYPLYRCTRSSETPRVRGPPHAPCSLFRMAASDGVCLIELVSTQLCATLHRWGMNGMGCSGTSRADIWARVPWWEKCIMCANIIKQPVPSIASSRLITLCSTLPAHI